MEDFYCCYLWDLCGLMDLGYFKEFMRLKDTKPQFDKVKIKGEMGMSCMLQLEDGRSGRWSMKGY